MDSNTRERGIVKGKLTRIVNYVRSLGDTCPSLQMLQIRLEALDEVKGEFNEVQAKIEGCCDRDNLDAEEQERSDFEDRWSATKEKLMILYDQKSTSSQQNVPVNSDASRASVAPKVKLPKLDLPSFSGELLKWNSFHDLFSALVDKNPTLAPVEKLQYLKGSLKGEAAQLLQSVLVTDANYNEAWEILKSRYENTKLIVFEHINDLFTYPNLKKESYVELRKLFDNATEHVRALKVLQQPVEHWNAVLVYIVTQKLDAESRKQWELASPEKSIPEFKDLVQFLENRCNALQAARTTHEKTDSSKPADANRERTQRHSVRSSLAASQHVCHICQESHFTSQCPRLKNASIEDRKTIIQQNSLCFNCLRPKHSAKNCKSSNSCQTCGKRHHTLLHIPANKSDRQRIQDEMSSNGNSRTIVNTDAPKPMNSTFTAAQNCTASLHSGSQVKSQILLATVQLQVQNNWGEWMIVRALLDPGSQINFISEQLVNQLRIPRCKVRGLVCGIGQSDVCNQIKGQVQVRCRSQTCNYAISLDAVILPKITHDLPSAYVDLESISEAKSLLLADYSFHKPDKVDLLLNAEVFAEVLLNQSKSLHKSGLRAQNSKFGWLVFGRIPANSLCQSQEYPPLVSNLVTSLEDSVAKFWEIENVPQRSKFSEEELECEAHFVETHTRLDDGRYQLKIPFRDEPVAIGESRKQAISRFFITERRLNKSPELKSQYVDFMDEYQTLGHMEPVHTSELNLGECFYIPHHEVVRESTTTKLRVVFDASAKDSNGSSLNDKMLIGPQFQDSLFSLLLRFRKHYVPFSADIEKMYRQIWIHPAHRNWLRIVWRSSADEPIRTFRLKTVTYGTRSAPYQATRVLKQLAHDERINYPRAANILEHDFYMDDCLSGADSEDEAIQIQAELKALLKTGGFNLRKWSSSNTQLMQSILPEERETKLPIMVGDTTKTLGIMWYPASDEFSIVSKPKNFTHWCKRSILASIASCYDPMGWVAPVIIQAKILMQELWRLKEGWDDPLPASIVEQWDKVLKDLEDIVKLRIPRHVGSRANTRFIRLHGFCDASERAYAACIYLQVIHDDETKVSHLLCAKTKVAPLKKITLPRLELCAALLLSKLMKIVLESLSIKIDEILAWSDSKIVLAWILSQSTKLDVFVRNRIFEIHDNLPAVTWKYVSTNFNPADIPSRGMSTAVLKDNSLWWHGPENVLDATEETIESNSSVPAPANEAIEDKETYEEDNNHETEQQACSVTVSEPKNLSLFDELMDKYSSYNRLVRVLAFTNKFIERCRRVKFETTSEKCMPAGITAEELETAKLQLVKFVQWKHFESEIRVLERGQSISRKSSLSAFNPMLYKGLLVVNGRTVKAPINFNASHQTILPYNSRLSQLLVVHYHERYLHAGPTLTLAMIRQKYWILKGRRLVSTVLRSCVKCFKSEPKPACQLMSPLPEARVTPSRPFSHVGIDYAGPVTTKVSGSRGRARQEKAYIAVFVCFMTKAIHLELVSSLSTSAFLAAFARFVSRRGLPAKMYSDRGSNFVRANKELHPIQSIVHSEPVQVEVRNYGCDWQFIPPSAPHFGGLWESAVKSVKYHLRRVIGKTVLTFEQYSTLLTRVEACLNSRPLYATSDSHLDPPAITPNHFLIGSNPFEIPPVQLQPLNNLENRWHLIQTLTESYWKAFYKQYISQLQPRHKWRTKFPNLEKGDVVIIKENDVAPAHWRLGRIEEVHFGDDQLVRSATVKTSSGILCRPIVKLCKLPFPHASQSALSLGGQDDRNE